MVVKAYAEGAWTTGQGDTQDGVFTGNMGHLTLLLQSIGHYAQPGQSPLIDAYKSARVKPAR
ncbi:hypothetical protein D3C76_1729760 [compost metagenome]